MSLKSGQSQASSCSLNRSLNLYADDFPSSAAFDVINDSLKSNEAERKDAIEKGGAIFVFKLKNKAGKEESWYIDLKEKGEVCKGEPKKANGKADPQYHIQSADKNYSNPITVG
jgi:SCP-2 sterol transfer family